MKKRILTAATALVATMILGVGCASTEVPKEAEGDKKVSVATANTSQYEDRDKDKAFSLKFGKDENTKKESNDASNTMDSVKVVSDVVESEKNTTEEYQKATESSASKKNETVQTTEEVKKTESGNKKSNTATQETKPTKPSIESNKTSVGTAESKKEETTAVSSTSKSETTTQTEKPSEPVQRPVVEEKKPCVSHDLELTGTEVLESYQLYYYVSDSYKCKNCEYTTTKEHEAPSKVSSADIAKAEAEIVAAVNQLREENGLSTLWTNGTWNSWADKRAGDLINNYSHSGWTHAESDTYTVAENIAAGQLSGYGFYKAFFNSAQHKSAMLSKDAVGIAVGIRIADDGTTYCAMSLIANK